MTDSNRELSCSVAGFSDQLADDVCAYAQHGGRTTLSRQDFELLFFRQRLVKTPDPLAVDDLIRQFLNMEDVAQLIPVARAHNKVVPGVKASGVTRHTKPKGQRAASDGDEDASDE